MTKQQVLALARKKWGKTAGVSRNPRGGTKKGRAYARERWEIAKAEKPVRKPLCFECDKNRIDHSRAFRAWEKEERQWWSRMMSYQYRVYHDISGLFREIKAEGDSWQEVIKKAGLA